MNPAVLELPVAYRDVCAGDLRLHLGLPPQDALVVRSFDEDGWALQLRILGASHQALLHRDGSSVCSETVACRPGHDGQGRGLARRHVRSTAGVAYRFRSTTTRLEAVAFRRRVDDVVARLVADPRTVCGAFPGDALAVTGVRVRFGPGDGVSWRSWHTYPQTGEVVVTSTDVQWRAAPGAGVG